VSIRHESPENRRALAVSTDGATGWSRPELHPELWEPVCMAGLVAVVPSAREARSVLLFSNPASLDPIAHSAPDRPHRQRRNLTLRASRDGGLTWPVSLVLEAGPSAYSDLAANNDGTIYCFFERGERGPYEKLTVARLPLAQLQGESR
jgi:sialidase-1